MTKPYDVKRMFILFITFSKSPSNSFSFNLASSFDGCCLVAGPLKSYGMWISKRSPKSNCLSTKVNRSRMTPMNRIWLCIFSSFKLFLNRKGKRNAVTARTHMSFYNYLWFTSLSS